MFAVRETNLSGCYEIQPRVLDDARGRFVKVFHEEAFAKLGLTTQFAEEYYSRSIRGVVRGMHFQTPPADHVKMVYCVEGEVFDVVLDLRLGSPTFGQTATFQLGSERGNCIYISKGLAHGFCATSDVAIMVYKVTSVYDSQQDSGVLWSSVDVPWPVSSPVISARDAGFKPFAEFESPFAYY